MNKKPYKTIKTTFHHIIFKLQKTKEKEKILKKFREKNNAFTYRGKKIDKN